MTISIIFNMLKEYIFYAVCLTLFISLFFYFTYFIVHKKTFKFSKSKNFKKTILYASFFIYIVIILFATLARASCGFRGINLNIFVSYIEAWNTFSKITWLNIILNIVMFIPLGFLLPLVFKSCTNFKKTYAIGFLFSLTIELLQLLTNKGSFDIDDIFNNTLGCFIGYGFIAIFIYFHKKKYLFLSQIPLVITIIAFITIFQVYSMQELGNLSINSDYKVSMKNINVSKDIDLKDSRNKAFTYSAPVGNKEDSLNKAKEVFGSLNLTVDETKTNILNETIIYESNEGSHSLWVDYVGLTWDYTNFNESDHTYNESLSYSDLKEILSIFNTPLPENANLSYKEGIGYIIDAFEPTLDGNLIYGNSSCKVSKDNIVTNFDNKIISYKKYKEYDIISEKEAYDKIINGEFKYLPIQYVPEIHIINVKLKYLMDTKGFLQPVYEFTLKDNETSLQIPALV